MHVVRRAGLQRLVMGARGPVITGAAEAVKILDDLGLVIRLV